MLALDVAASASSPSRRPTQIALIEPFSDCSTFPARIGRENISSVGAIAPSVRLRPERA
jgi:hypothetical protein